MKKLQKSKFKLLTSVLSIACILAALLLLNSCSSTKGMTFELNEDETEYTLTDYEGSEKKIKIPEKYNKKPVTAIGDEAFKDCETVKSVKIPDTVKSVGANAFSGCKALSEITFAGEVEKYGVAAFAYCTALTEITIPEGAKSLPSALFIGSENLESVVLPASLESLFYGTFLGCDNIEYISVQKGNKKFHSAGNCVIETATKTLVVGTGSSVIPDDGSVEIIGEGAFYSRKTLPYIVIPKSVKTVEKEAFLNCEKLRYVRLLGVEEIKESAFHGCVSIHYILVSKELDAIYDLAFWNCSALKKIYYEGNDANWGSISTTPETNGLHNATVFYYSETQPTVKGKFWHYSEKDIIEVWPEVK